MPNLCKFGCPACGHTETVGNADKSIPTSHECTNCHVESVPLNTESREKYFHIIRKQIEEDKVKMLHKLFMKIWTEVGLGE